MTTKRIEWLKKSERKLNYKQAEKLLDYWMKALGMGDYAFKIILTKDGWEGKVEFEVGVHYGEISFSTERVLVHELLEAMLLRYFRLVDTYKYCSHASDGKNIEYLVRHIFLFQLTNCLLKLKYGES